MKKIEYSCNLCRETKTVSELTALYFKCGIIPQRYVLDKSRVADCDKHICNGCIQIIKEHGKQ